MDEKKEKTTSLNSDVEKIQVETSSTISNEPFVMSAAERRLVRKINWVFMPFACLILFIQFIDKSVLSMISVIPEFFEDTGISKDQYAWLASLFYLGFLCMQIPNNYMLQKFEVSKYVGVCLMIWGTSLICTAWGKNFAQLAGLRFVLGFLEAITYPAVFLLIGSIYRRSEQVIWFGALFMSNGVAGMIGGFVGVGIMKMPTVGVITPWKWAFIIFGSITTFMGIVYFFFLPDKPTSRWFRLTEEEELIVEERVRDNGVIATLKVNYDHIREALREPRFYCYCLISCLNNLQNGAFTVFSGIIISGMGYSNTNAILLTTPTNATTIILLAIATNYSKKKGEIIYVAIVTCIISLIGLLCLTFIPSGGVRLLGIYLQSGGTATYVLMQASITSNVSGYTKKIFYTSGNLIFYTFGNFIGPLLLRDKDAPRYIMGMAIYVVANVIILFLFGYIRYSYVQANKRRNLDKNSNVVALPGALEDLTDVQNIHFVYRP